MKPVEIKILLLRKRITQTQIAQKSNVTVGMVSGVINHRFISQRIRQAIADSLRMKIEQLWPENKTRKAA